MITTCQRIGGAAWRFTWSGGTAPYSVWLRGVKVYTGVDTSYTVELPLSTDAPPAVEVCDATETAQQAVYPGRMLLQWQRDSEAVTYVVHEYTGAAWVTIARMGQQADSEYIHYLTSWLTDCASAQFRVYAVNIHEEPSDPLAITHMIARVPDPPAVTITNDSGTVTVAEA